MVIVLPHPVGFEWDQGNLRKNEDKHDVGFRECEEVFFNQPLVLVHAKKISGENRNLALGVTDEHRRLAIVYTMREDRIRVISARDMSKKERMYYDKA